MPTVPMTPTRPERVACTSARTPGSITPTTGTALRGQLVERGRGRGVAGDHHQLDVVALDEDPGELAGEHAHLGPRAGTVGVAAGVAEVDEVLGREQVDDGPGDGEAAEAGVEHADGPVIGAGSTGRRAPA